MKNRKFAYIAGTTMALMICGLTSCGQTEKLFATTEEQSKSIEESKTEEKSLNSYPDVAKYVTLGAYQHLEVEMPRLSASEEEINTLAYQVFCSYVTGENGGITNRPAQLGDTVVLDYTENTEGMEEHTHTETVLKLSDDINIPGLAETLDGAMPGNSVTAVLDYPEDYSEKEVAGKEVAVTATIQYIIPEEMTDEIVSSFKSDQFKTVDELKKYARQYSEAYYESIAQSTTESYVMDAFLHTCIFFEIPQEIIEKYRSNLETALKTDAEYYDMEIEDFMQKAYGMSMEDFLDESGEESAKQEIAMLALADKEGIELTKEELDADIAARAQMYNYEDVDSFLESNGGREEWEEYFLFNKVMAFLAENAEITYTDQSLFSLD